jgi:long-chain acyl-CoA synthetase
MSDLPARMRGNLDNVLTHGASTVPLRRRRYAEVYTDACAAVDLVRRAGGRLGPEHRAVVTGGPSYAWLLAALACLFTGTELVALPETLDEREAAASLQGLPVDLVFADEPLASHACFEGLPRIALAGLPERAAQHRGPDIIHGSPATVIAFTSGSTSITKLKSFRVDLGSTAAFADAFTGAFGLGHDSLWLVCHSLSHIVHLEYVLGGLWWGYDVALVDVLRLLMNGAELRPSVLVTVPSVYEQLASRIRRARAKRASQVAARSRPSEPRPALTEEAIAVIGDRIEVMVIGAAPSSAPLQHELLAAGLPLFEGYGMSELGMIACNVPGHARVGTVGRAWPGVDLRVDPDGTVLARLRHPRATSYLNVPSSQSAETFLADGWVDTGDLGELEGGCLRIVGRKKEIIITAGGQNVNAAAIEARLREIPGVGHVLVTGDRRPFLVAIVAPGPDAPLPDDEALRAAIAMKNRGLPPHEHVLDVVRLATPLDVESGLLTRSGKPRRRVVAERYEREIASCYP